MYTKYNPELINNPSRLNNYFLGDCIRVAETNANPDFKRKRIWETSNGHWRLCDMCYQGIVENGPCKMHCTFCNVKPYCGDVFV